MATMMKLQESQPQPSIYRTRQVLKSLLNGKNKVRAFNTFEMSLIRYPVGIITWPKEEIDDIKTL